MEIPYGYCHCGCGEKTKISKNTIPKCEAIRGKPNKFLRGHHNILNHPHNWNNGRKIDAYGYILVLKRSHHRANIMGYVFEHILIAEKALGKPILEKTDIHHIDGNKSNNCNTNLVICQDRGYHHFLHRRQRALQACGHANWKRCNVCGEWDVPNNIHINSHRACKTQYDKKRRTRIKLGTWAFRS